MQFNCLCATLVYLYAYNMYYILVYPDHPDLYAYGCKAHGPGYTAVPGVYFYVSKKAVNYTAIRTRAFGDERERKRGARGS